MGFLRELKSNSSAQVKENYLLKKATSLHIGGPAKYFLDVFTEDELKQAIICARAHKVNWEVIGEGSNIVAGDKGFSGLIIRNKIQGFKRNGNRVVVGAGMNLLELIFQLNKLGVSGLEKMAGIPGSVGGAVYGSAGAYGQEIQERVVRVRFYDAGTNRYKNYSHKQIKFGYRDSIFKKHKNWVITEVELKMSRGESRQLMQISKKIIKLREKKYKPGIKCPGSFFKNIKILDIGKPKQIQKFLSQMEHPLVMYGKVPVGYLLEKVNANGEKQGNIRVAQYHGNLIYNTGGAKARDVRLLAERLKKKVQKKFGIMIEEEIQYLGE